MAWNEKLSDYIKTQQRQIGVRKYGMAKSVSSGGANIYHYGSVYMPNRGANMAVWFITGPTRGANRKNSIFRSRFIRELWRERTKRIY